MATTNAHDLQEAAKLQARLSDQRNAATTTKTTTTRLIDSSSSSVDDGIPSVHIDAGAHKYVLITAVPPQQQSHQRAKRTFVRSKRGASYHRNVAEDFLPVLESAGYGNIDILGGGRILRDDVKRKVHIFGYSYGFGKADHEEAVRIVEEWGGFKDYEVSWSNEGY